MAAYACAHGESLIRCAHLAPPLPPPSLPYPHSPSHRPRSSLVALPDFPRLLLRRPPPAFFVGISIRVHRRARPSATARRLCRAPHPPHPPRALPSAPHIFRLLRPLALPHGRTRRSAVGHGQQPLRPAGARPLQRRAPAHPRCSPLILRCCCLRRRIFARRLQRRRGAVVRKQRAHAAGSPGHSSSSSFSCCCRPRGFSCIRLQFSATINRVGAGRQLGEGGRGGGAASSGSSVLPHASCFAKTLRTHGPPLRDL